MAPRPRPLIRKVSVSGLTPPVIRTNATKPAELPASKAAAAAALMPPPPNPLPVYAILEREVKALEPILKNATLKAAQLYAFHADCARLKLGHDAPRPPRSLIQSLGQEVERYDQLCDIIEAQLQRSIAVLQRDITREEAKLQEQEAVAVIEARLKTPVVSPTTTRPLALSIDSQVSPIIKEDGHAMVVSPTTTAVPPSLSTSSSGQMSPPLGTGSSFLARRQSVITQSSLHRPSTASLPKLDLSSSSLRINPEELMRGLGSPVTLAPRSARTAPANDISSDLFSAITASASATLPSAVNMTDTIDLTMDAPMLDPNTMSELAEMPMGDTIDLTLNAGMPSMEGIGTLGSSADKPIELDLDVDLMPDVFGDAPSLTGSTADTSIPLPSVFDAPTAPGRAGPSASELLQSLTENASADMMASLAGSIGSAPSDTLAVPSSLQMGGTPSPASLLSSLDQQQATIPWDLNGFDFGSMPDLPEFPVTSVGDVSMEDVFGLGASSSSST